MRRRGVSSERRRSSCRLQSDCQLIHNPWILLIRYGKRGVRNRMRRWFYRFAPSQWETTLLCNVSRWLLGCKHRISPDIHNADLLACNHKQMPQSALWYFVISVTYPKDFIESNLLQPPPPPFNIAAIFVKYCYTTGSWLFRPYRPYSRQVTEQLPLSGSFHSLCYLARVRPVVQTYELMCVVRAAHR